jgi:hypothetical protein
MDLAGDKAGAGRAAVVRINDQTDHFLLHRALVEIWHKHPFLNVCGRSPTEE